MKPLNEMTQQELNEAAASISAELVRRQDLAREAERLAAEEANKRRASAHIAERLNQIAALYEECASLAKQHNIEFSFVFPDGVTGWYDSNGWQNSSMNC